MSGSTTQIDGCNCRHCVEFRKDTEIAKLRAIALRLVEAVEFVDGCYDRRSDEDPNVAPDARKILDEQLAMPERNRGAAEGQDPEAALKRE